MNLSSGCIVEYSAKGTMPEIGAVLSNASGTVRLMLLNGKETNIQKKEFFCKQSERLFLQETKTNASNF